MGYGRSWSRYDDYGSGGWPPYVPVAERRAKAAAYAKSLEKKSGRKLAPVTIEGRKIATSFWGKAWCENLEGYSDFANRLPRGRTYVCNGSVIDLQIAKGKITALVSGSEVYTLTISIDALTAKMWKQIQGDCARSVSSLIDLLQGRFDRGVMERLTRREDGLFPKPKEIKMDCSCPDYAGMCKHIAAVLYGVGARLDQSPELLFTLRNVDHLELIGEALAADNLDRALTGAADDALNATDLGEMFGIELDTSTTTPAPKARRGRTPAQKSKPATVAKKPIVAKPAPKRRRTAVATKAAIPAASATTQLVGKTSRRKAQPAAEPVKPPARPRRAK